jgi:ankyrin repeat protein
MALHSAAFNGHEAVVKLLLNHGADINAADRIRQLPFSGHEAIVRLLLNRGVDFKAIIHNGRTSLHFAAQNGHEAIVRLLLNRGADFKAISHD